jgi:hypothetical protein
MASGFSGSEGSISAGGVGERLMGLGIFFVSATDVGGSTVVGVSTGNECSTDEGVSTDVGVSTGNEGSTDEGNEVCVSGVSGVFKSGLSAIRSSLVVAGADWVFCGFFVFFAAIRKCVGVYAFNCAVTASISVTLKSETAGVSGFTQTVLRR